MFVDRGTGGTSVVHQHVVELGTDLWGAFTFVPTVWRRTRKKTYHVPGIVVVPQSHEVRVW